MSKSHETYAILVNNKVMCRDLKQVHIRGVIYGLMLDQIKYMSDEALKNLILMASEMIEDGIGKPTKTMVLTEARIRKFVGGMNHEQLLSHIVEHFLKVEELGLLPHFGLAQYSGGKFRTMPIGSPEKISILK